MTSDPQYYNQSDNKNTNSMQHIIKPQPIEFTPKEAIQGYKISPDPEKSTSEPTKQKSVDGNMCNTTKQAQNKGLHTSPQSMATQASAATSQKQHLPVADNQGEQQLPTDDLFAPFQSRPGEPPQREQNLTQEVQNEGRASAFENSREKEDRNSENKFSQQNEEKSSSFALHLQAPGLLTEARQRLTSIDSVNQKENSVGFESKQIAAEDAPQASLSQHQKETQNTTAGSEVSGTQKAKESPVKLSIDTLNAKLQPSELEAITKPICLAPESSPLLGPPQPSHTQQQQIINQKRMVREQMQSLAVQSYFGAKKEGSKPESSFEHAQSKRQITCENGETSQSQTRYQSQSGIRLDPKGSYMYEESPSNGGQYAGAAPNMSSPGKKTNYTVSKGLIRGDAASEKANTAKRTGRWTREEHFRFLEALKLFGKEWKRVQMHVGTRSSTQARSHAQKFFVKLDKKSKTLEQFLDSLDMDNLMKSMMENDSDYGDEYDEETPSCSTAHQKSLNKSPSIKSSKRSQLICNQPNQQFAPSKISRELDPKQEVGLPRRTISDAELPGYDIPCAITHSSESEDERQIVSKSRAAALKQKKNVKNASLLSPKKETSREKLQQSNERPADEEELPLAGQKRKASENSFVMQARLRRQHSSKTPTKSESQSFHMKRQKSEWQKFEATPCTSLLQAQNKINQQRDQQMRPGNATYPAAGPKAGVNDLQYQMKQFDASQGFQLPLGLPAQPYLMSDQLGDQQVSQQIMALAAQQRQDQQDGSAFKKASLGLNVTGQTPLAGLEFMGSHIHGLPPQTVSQTPRLKASTYKSPILDPAEIPAQRANSLLDKDLAFMSASGLQDQDELPEDASKESGNENELDMEFAVQERRPMDPFIPEMATYDGQRQLVMGQPLDVADNFPYRHRAQTFAQPLPNPMFHGLGAEGASKPRDVGRPRNSFDFNEPCMGANQHDLYNQEARDTYEQAQRQAELRNSRYGFNRSHF